MSITHIHMTIKRAQEMAYGGRSDQNTLKRMFEYDSIEDLRNELNAMLGRGLTVIPNGSCNNKATTGECLGHPDKVEA